MYAYQETFGARNSFLPGYHAPIQFRRPWRLWMQFDGRNIDLQVPDDERIARRAFKECVEFMGDTPGIRFHLFGTDGQEADFHG